MCQRKCFVLKLLCSGKLKCLGKQERLGTLKRMVSMRRVGEGVWAVGLVNLIRGKKWWAMGISGDQVMIKLTELFRNIDQVINSSVAMHHEF